MAAQKTSLPVTGLLQRLLLVAGPGSAQSTERRGDRVSLGPSGNRELGVSPGKGVSLLSYVVVWGKSLRAGEDAHSRTLESFWLQLGCKELRRLLLAGVPMPGLLKRRGALRWSDFLGREVRASLPPAWGGKYH